MNLRAPLIMVLFFGLVWMIIIGLGSAFTPLLIAFGLAYLLFPVIKKIEAWGFKRHYTVLAVFFLSSFVSIATIVAFVPGLVEDFRSLLQSMPDAVGQFIDKASRLASEYGYDLAINQESAKQYIIEHTSEISSTLLSGITDTFKGLFSNALRWFLAVLNVFLIPLFFFYLINDFEKITEGFQSLIPPAVRPKVSHYLELSNQVLNGYIRGQILVAAILSMLYGIGLSIVGLKFGFLVGFISGWLSIIPYVGFTMGLITSIILGLANYNGLGPFVGIFVVFGIVQALEGTVITPRLVGNKVGLNALTTMLALIIGGNLLGLVGMLVAIPTAAVMKLLLIEAKKEYQDLEFYKRK